MDLDRYYQDQTNKSYNNILNKVSEFTGNHTYTLNQTGVWNPFYIYLATFWIYLAIVRDIRRRKKNNKKEFLKSRNKKLFLPKSFLNKLMKGIIDNEKIRND